MALTKQTSFPWLHYLRRAVQVGITVAAVWTGYRYAVGLTLTTVEKYCPMGGLATGHSVMSEGQFSCATGEFNFSLILALLGLALLARKSFCSWICPVGTVSELLGNFVGTRKGKRRRVHSGTNSALMAPPRKVDTVMRWLRFPVLGAVIYATIVSGELLFRPFCPYYVMTSFHGHDVEMWSYAFLAVLLVGMLIIPFVWCRYLCPLGGAMWPFSRIGVLRVQRHPDACIDCGKCDRACGHSLPVSTSDEVRSGECTLCLECTQACPVPEALSLKGAGSTRRWPRLLVPLALVVMAGGGLVAGQMYSIPSYAKEFAPESSAQNLSQVDLKVKGVRCVDTAALAATVFEGMDGIVRYTAYASRNDVEVVYDSRQIDVDMIVKLVEGPVFMEDTGEYVFKVFKVLEVDGKPVDTATSD